MQHSHSMVATRNTTITVIDSNRSQTTPGDGNLEVASAADEPELKMRHGGVLGFCTAGKSWPKHLCKPKSIFGFRLEYAIMCHR